MSQGQAAGVSGSLERGRPVSGSLTETPAYRGGWRDGRFGPLETFVTNRNLAAWEGVERLAYYRGYREGLRIRKMLMGG